MLFALWATEAFKALRNKWKSTDKFLSTHHKGTVLSSQVTILHIMHKTWYFKLWVFNLTDCYKKKNIWSIKRTCMANVKVLNVS